MSPDVLLQHGDDLTAIDYLRPSNHLLPESVYVGDDTTALLLHLTDDSQQTEPFYRAITTFYTAIVKKLLNVQNFKSPLWSIFSFLGTHQSTHINIGLLDGIEKDKSQVKLEAREFVIDPEIDGTERDGIQFWLKVNSLHSPLGERKYHHLAHLALNILSIPASNADSECVLSLVRRIKTDFRASLSTETVSALIGCHLNNTFKCCEKKNLTLHY